MQSVTEEDSFQEFLRKAELAGTEFQAEKLNIQFVSSKSKAGLLSDTEKSAVKKLIDDNQNMLRIPRRPKWTKDTSADELRANENQSFLEWRRDLALLQEKEGLVITPYEKNLEFWRQLWRVIERSDVVVQIVDSRNPLLFRCEDLEKYVKEVDSNKQNVLLLNKADFLTDEQRRVWAEYFDNQKIKIAFFSALEPESEGAKAESDDDESSDDSNDDETSDGGDDEESDSKEKKLTVDEIREKAAEIEKNLDEAEKLLEQVSFNNEGKEQPQVSQETQEIKNSSKILTRQELIDFFKSIRESHPSAKEIFITIGLTGYPNVGKSSTINALLQEKKVSVSATPGKTKHFQTLFLDRELILCDCCGLVLPSFCFTKAEMILNGILPIDQMRDHVPAVNTLCTLIPRHVLEDTYGILITKPLEGEDPNRPPHSEELLLAYGYNRGFMTANGQPDQSRSARRLLKDFVNGKLLYCTAPPTVEQNQFHTFPERQKEVLDIEKLPPRQQRAIAMKLVSRVTSKDIDDIFFRSTDSQAHIKGRNVMNFKPPVMGAQQIGSSSSLSSGISKPWKGQKREKREKLRRKYAHLDQH